MSKDNRNNSTLTDPGAVEHLSALIPDDNDTLRLVAQERLRVWITDGLRRLRQIRGLSQSDLAERLGITQARVSRLESVDFDRRVDSLAAYLHAAEAEIVLAFKVGDELIPVQAPKGSRISLEPDDQRFGGDEDTLHVPVAGSSLELATGSSYEMEYASAA